MDGYESDREGCEMKIRRVKMKHKFEIGQQVNLFTDNEWKTAIVKGVIHNTITDQDDYFVEIKSGRFPFRWVDEYKLKTNSELKAKKVIKAMKTINYGEKSRRVYLSDKYERMEQFKYYVFVRYAEPDMIPMEQKIGGDWIDLRSAEDVSFKKGEFKLISLGFAMKLPDGYEAHVVPRSSTFKNFGIIQTNHMGVIDNSYSGNDDIWHFPALAVRDTGIHKNDRICQFRIVRNQPKIVFETVDKLSDTNRGGIGSTGIK